VPSGIAAEAMRFPDVDFPRQRLAELEVSLVRMLSAG
jgi:hypothetical protein